MADHYATPSGAKRRLPNGSKEGMRFQDAIDKAGPGDTIHLLPGLYDEPVVFDGKRATREQPITVESDGCATLDGRRNVLRPSNIDKLDFDKYAFVKIRNSCGIVLKSTTIQNVWPTAIYIQESQHITIRELNLNGATYGVFARGASTQHLTLEHCSWIQDTRIWDEVSWRDIHDPPNPRRELDGDFFRSLDIKGNVVVRNNFIAQAFNGVHLFASEEAAKRGEVNENVWVYRNTFAFIRDSAVEAERIATNWWVFENKIYNCHTWFAFEKCRGGHWYIFANRGWFDRKPGPTGDFHAGGAVIKTNRVDDDEIDTALPQHPHYVFNNSWYLRSPVLKKGKLRHFRHFNNAIAYARPEHHPVGVVDLGRRMIGVGAPDPRCDGNTAPEEPFTKQWKECELDIQFDNDVCNHPDFPAGLNLDGYPVRGLYTDPAFVSGRDGNFVLAVSSPCRAHGRAAQLTLADGRIWELPGSLDVGAMRGELPYAPDDLACPRDVLPDDYEHEPEA